MKFLLMLGLGYALLVAGMYLGQRGLLYPGASIGGALPQTVDWADRVMIETPDGEQLAAFHAPAGADRPTLLFFHGNADRIDRYGFLAAALGRHGIGLLAVSYRGYPGSTGSPSEDGLLADGLAAHDWLAANASGDVIPFGQSLGTGVAVHVGAERDVPGLILVSAYDSILEVARRAYFFLPVAPLIKDDFRSDLRIAAVRVPKLFVHGARDTVIPLARGQALYEIAPEPKRMIVLDAYGHNDIWGEGLVAEIVAFAEATNRSRGR